MAGGGGGKTSNTTSSNAPETTLTGTSGTGDIANITGGSFTQNTLDAGAIQAAFAGNTEAINSATSLAKSTLDSGTSNLANLINFASATETGAADLITKSIGLAATVAGANTEAVKALTTPAPSATPAQGALDLSKIIPIAIGGVTLYLFFKGKK